MDDGYQLVNQLLIFLPPGVDRSVVSPTRDFRSNMKQNYCAARIMIAP